VTASSLSEPSAVILAACDGTIPQEDLRASTSGLDSEEVTQSSFDLEELHFRTSSI